MKKLLSYFVLISATTFALAQQESLLDKVNLYIGTADDYGQMTPGATVPYGQIQVCPDSKPRQHPGYDYEVPAISGFSINRLSGVGGSGCGGNVSLMPDATGQDVRLLKHTEQASPGYYSVQLSNGVWFTATADRRMAVERFTFPEGKGQEAVLLLNPRSAFDKVFAAGFEQKEPTMGQGFAQCANTCGRGRYHLHYRLYTSSPFVLDTISDGRKRLTFPELSARYVEVRIVVSTGLADELDKMPEQAVWRTDFLTFVERARRQWGRLLATVEVEGGTKDQQTIFYTSLYRTFHSPFQVTDRQMTHYLGTDGKTHEAEGFQYYSSWSLWDTYRTKFPLITLLDESHSGDIMQSLSQLYITGKKDWSTDHECVPTVRTEHAIATLLDAYRQGIGIPSLREAYPGMVKEVKRLSLKSPDQCLEASGDFWALGQLAEELGLKEDALLWTKRGEAIFDSIWPKEFQNIDETYTKMRGNGLYQGTRWQYRWGAPMYLPRMIQLVGKEKLAAQLQQFFREELYNQGNEPDIHVPFLFGRLGMPRQTGSIVRSLATESITHRYGGNDAYPTPFVGCAFEGQPRGYCPEMDEDDGAMSAWYVFASIGMYPLIVGEAVYELFPPLFDKVTLHLGTDRQTTVVVRKEGARNKETSAKRLSTNGAQEGAGCKRVTWNGKALPAFSIPVKELKKGGELVFHMDE
ncbi:MAG: glycoside hydrolase family 92 protein [Bacteroidaceae bacterium]|nr:glycoside hydrolase family 92 protein [Bacteroidaceae bacterium]